MTALLARLQASGAFKTTGRRLVHWSKVNEQPALFLVDGSEHYPEGEYKRPRRITIEAEAWLYSNAGSDPDAAPASELNDLIDAVEQAIAPPEPFRLPQTLGLSAVLSCRIMGRIVKDPGHLGGQAIAIVPIHIEIAELHP